MKVILIKPTIGQKGDNLYVDEGRMEPLMLGVLAGLTPDDVEVEIYDDRIESIPYDIECDLVGITVETYMAKRSYEIAQEFRKRGVKVIMGGIHVTLMPDEVKNHCDSIVLGDAESIWGRVIEDLKNKKLERVYKGVVGIAQGGGVKPRRDLYKGKNYLPLSLMQFSRGCKYSCDFCAVSKYFDKTHYVRRIDEVLEEIVSQERRFIFFVDDNIASHKEALKDLCRELIPMKINWISQAGIDITRDLELMGLMADSGCIGNVIGFESITPASLKNANKHFNLKDFNNYKHEIDVLRDHAMQTWAAFTLGYDHDTYDSIMATKDFAIKNRFTFAAFNILTAYPNTPLYENLKRENRLLYDGEWWLHPDYRFNNATFIPKNLTPDQLTEVCNMAREEFNSIPALLYRFSDLKTNLKSIFRAVSYLKYSTLFRREVFKKNGMRLGRK